MKKLILPLLAMAAALGLTSCFQSETVVYVSKDGSGKIVEEMTFGEEVKKMMAEMSAGLGGEGAAPKDPLADMMSEDKAKAKAATLGEGVTFEKVEKIKNGTREGFRVTYKFKDISKVKLSLGDAKPPGAPDEGGKDEPITFAYAANKLTVKLPKPDAAEKEDGAEEGEEEEEEGPGAAEEEQMKKMLGDMKVSVRIVAEGGIEKTDASHTSGNTITLMEMDFGKVVKNPEAFKKLKKAGPPKGPEDMEKLFKGVDGIKMESKPEISVTLK